MEPEFSGVRNSSAQLLEELEVLSQSLYQSHTYTTSTRRTASFALPRTSIPTVSSTASILTSKNEEKISQSMRMPGSSSWRSRPKPDHENRDKSVLKLSDQKEIKWVQDNVNKLGFAEKKGIWNWKPIRALSHIGMQKFSCLFSVDVVNIHGLPASMNGLRLSVCVRKKENKDAAVKTMPARVLGGVADFEETLFVKCHVYGSPGSGNQLKFECRPFLIYVFAVDAQELDFGRSSVDLSLLVQESMEKSSEGTRVRQWDGCFVLSGKAQGAELVVKLGFQIMEKDGGLGIYGQADEGLKSSSIRNSLASSGRKQSRSSFSVPSQRMTNRMEISTSPKANFEVIENFNLYEPAPIPSSSSSVQKSEEPESKIDDHDLPEFEVVDKGVEIEDQSYYAKEAINERSVSSDVVKEVMNDQFHWTRFTELDSIAQQIKTLESMMADGSSVRTEEETESQKLDDDEEAVTKEFLQMLEGEEQDEFEPEPPDNPPLNSDAEADPKVFLPDLGEGLGCVVQTKDGGYLAAMNPFNIELSRKETPKLAMQLSKPLLLLSQKSMSGFEMYQKMATIGLEELSSEILTLMPLDELIGKTAGQVAFEGIASAIIQGRNTEVATSRAAQSISAVKNMATAMSTGRKDRTSMGIWNVNREPITVDDILAFSLQKMEAMAVEALKIQAEMADEDAPFEVSSIFTFCRKDLNRLFASAVPLEDCLKNGSLDTVEGEPILPETVTLSVLLQLRDPVRRYEQVGGPMIVLIQATRTQGHDGDDERFNVVSLHIGGLKVSGGRKRHMWDAEKQRLTAMLWLVENGLAKEGKKRKPLPAKALDSLWSISSRVMADMWLKQIRNPDVKFLKQK